MQKWAQWLSGRMHQVAIVRRCLNGAFQIFVILPIPVLFCLILPGCDTEDGSKIDLVEPPGQNASLASTRTSVDESPRQEKEQSSKLPRIVAFGDSLTAGLGVDPAEAYPGQLARWLREQGFAYEVINAGVSGDTSAGGLRRVEWILKSQPQLVIVELGANDGLRGQPLEETYKNLNAIIESLKAKGIIVVLAGMQLPLNYGEDYTQEFSELYVRLAQKHELPFIPFFLEGVAMQRHLNQGDGLHPTAEGYAIVTQNVWKTLQPILKQLARKDSAQ